MIDLFKSVFLSPRGTISSKRLTGFLMITLAGCLIAFGIMHSKDFTANLTGLVRDLIYGGVALLSSTVFEKKFKSPENE